ncbi:MAG: transcription termination/antitermination protein NusA [SAR202 cluster bacterium]|nr:transcription termination/antitermination protein NusA [Chloroflexota bacterium]MQG47008.1 transcription termination/antitermination protein NusA [SAR202 cluster bacterium]
MIEIYTEVPIVKSDLLLVVTQLAAERNLPQSSVISVVKAALSAAYRRDPLAGGQDVEVDVDLEKGEVALHTVMRIVDEVEDPAMELTVEQAADMGHEVKSGDYIITGSLEHVPGRIAAQTAKQVVLQKLREAERDIVFDEFSDREGEILTATVQRIESQRIVVDLGKSEASMPIQEQSQYERYRPGQQLKFYLLQVGRSIRGPEILVSRTHPDLLRRLFEIEVPEIFNGVVEIKAIVRDPGSRSKVAVISTQEGVDAVGACVGLRGIRIQNVVNELLGEKIDVIEWDEDVVTYISNSLSPSSVENVIINEKDNSALVLVPDKQLSLAIGREGQNARLSARLTGWKIDIQPSVQIEIDKSHDVNEESNKIESELSEPVMEDLIEDVDTDSPKTDTDSPKTDIEGLEKELVEDVDYELLALEQELADLEKEERKRQETTETVVETLDVSSDDLWEIGKKSTADEGIIRFAEDISGYDRSKPIRKTAADSRPAKGKRGKR